MAEILDWREYCYKPETALGGNSVLLRRDGDEGFAEILRTIRAAKNYILLEFYSFADDSVGRMFRDLLLKKAGEGVKVYLIYDGAGSILTDGDFFAAMSAGGIETAEFRPVVLWKPWRWARRDHRKIVCADGETALVGGFNITVNDAPIGLGGRGWKDALVRVEGPVVGEVERLFRASWAAAGSGDIPVPGPGTSRMAGDIRAAVLSASGMRNFRSIRRSYSYAIDRARTYIYITNAYFLPDRFVYRRLIRAVKRGVDVRIIGPRKTDHPYVRWATWSIYPHMIKHGIKVYEWGGEILHSKTAVIDGIWSSVGSHNLDHRSLHYNLELNINIYDRRFGEEMAGVFKNDLNSSRLVTLAETKSRPFFSKAASKILYLFRSLL